MTKKLFLIAFFAVIASAGCASQKEKILPVHDEVLIYPLPYDVTYLRTIEALESVDDWEMEETEKEKGTIRVRNINFSSFDDADKRIANFLVKRVGRNKTSVELAPESQRIVGGDDLLKKVASYLNRESNV
jgi:uncharacterized lipoprotein